MNIWKCPVSIQQHSSEEQEKPYFMKFEIDIEIQVLYWNLQKLYKICTNFFLRPEIKVIQTKGAKNYTIIIRSEKQHICLQFNSLNLHEHVDTNFDLAKRTSALHWENLSQAMKTGVTKVRM